MILVPELRPEITTVSKNGSKFGTLSRGLTPALLGSRSDCEADFLGFEQNMGEISYG